MLNDQDLVGRWAICGHGRIGLIEGRRQLPWGLAWVGTGVDGRPWSSRWPTLVADENTRGVAAPSRGECRPTGA
jgi:hypothetical protein